MMSTNPVIAALLHADSALPSGAFAFSWGLEQLYADGVLDEKGDFSDVLQWYLRTRWATYDRYFVCRSCTATTEGRLALDRLCTASTVGAAGRDSSARAGRSMLLAWARMKSNAASEYSTLIEAGAAYGNLSVVQGLVYAEFGMDETLAASVSGWTFLSNIASAAVRMGRVGALSAQSSLVRSLDTLTEVCATELPDAPYSWGILQDTAMDRHALRRDRLFAS